MIEPSDAQMAPISPTSRRRPTSAGLVTVAPVVALVDMSDLSSDRGPRGACHSWRDPPKGQVSFSYAWSDFIVEINVIAEKCSSGFVLITQVTGLYWTLDGYRTVCGERPL